MKVNQKTRVVHLIKYLRFYFMFRRVRRSTKGVTRLRKSQKDRLHYGQKKKDKQRSTKHTHKTKD